MANKKNGRQTVAVEPNVYELLLQIKKETDVPIVKIISKAVFLYADKFKEAKGG